MRSRWNHFKSNNNNNTTPTTTTTTPKEPASAAAAAPYDEPVDDDADSSEFDIVSVLKTPLIQKYVYHVNITIIFIVLLLLIYLAIVIFQIVFSCYIDCINAAMIVEIIITNFMIFIVLTMIKKII